jgi:hypothetical protein
MLRKSRSDLSTRHREISEEMLADNPELIAKIKKAPEDQSEPMTAAESTPTSSIASATSAATA